MRCIILSLLTLRIMLLSQSALGADDCATKASSCALQGSRTLITDSILKDDCDGIEQFMDTASYPYTSASTPPRKLDTKSRFAPIGFLRGICNFHSSTRKLEQYDKTIDLLQTSVTTGLMPAQKSAAALFEGLSHCRAAADLKASLDKNGSGESSGPSSIKAHNQLESLYCVHRSMAKEAFSEVNWMGFKLDYQTETATRNLDAHIAEMASCGQAYLGSDQDTLCGSIATLPAEQVTTIATEAAAAEIPCYVSIPDEHNGGANSNCANPPMTAMMSRKLKMTADVLERSKVDFSNLKDQNTQLTDSFGNTLALYGTIDANDVLKASPGSIPKMIDTLQSDYLQTVRRAENLLALSKSWVDGLYRDTDGLDLRTFLDNRKAELQVQKEFLGDKNSGLFKDISDMASGIRTMAEDSATQNNSFLKSMCALYFCELKGRDEDAFKDTCNTVIGKTQVGTTYVNVTLAAKNHLCPAPPKVDHPELWGAVKDKDGKLMTVTALCKSAGFDSQSIRLDGPEDVNACMKTHFIASDLGVKL